ncbi:MAG: preprotein translocase subunit SecY [Deferribacteraceae bacterium]|jgi:preprotein translocase subunit SecY|nr:preprotein translocase subunit SecY [Deferribacteraceae bacterium]
MLKKIEEIFSIPDLRRRIVMTLLLLAVFRLGAHIPTPGINGEALAQFFARASGNLLGFFDMFTGGALQKMTVFGLGVMPYISASIILELLTVVVPHLGELKKRGTEGREKITRYTRYLTVFISMFQGLAIAIGIEGMTSPDGTQVVMNAGMSFRIITALTLTTGTIFLMWLGEKITSFGVGNGMSLIIMAGIIASLPSAVSKTMALVGSGEMQLIPLLGALAVMAAALIAVVFMETSQRRIPIQYVRKASVGGRMQTATSYLPLRLNPAGVIPIIFASTIVTLPPTLATFVTNPAVAKFASYFMPNHWFYYVLELIFIIFFTYFYTSIIFNPNDIAENIQKSGGVIPGKRPGAATGDYIDYVLSRLTFVGSIYLAIVAIMPQLIISAFKMPFYFGGTSILIVVGVGLDVIQKIESHLITNNYDGFLKKGRIKGRYS